MASNASSSSLGNEVSPRVRGLFLKNLADFQTELARVHAGFVPALGEWVQRSIDWLPRWTNVPTRGVLEFTEPDAAVPFRFYRARIWP